ncbi:tyrosine recombinase XerC [Clostridia bacterium]|nr:tyrosine recombinase XerC [Clostridia bacterium]
MKFSKEAIELSRHINVFLFEYAPQHKTNSEHTLKSYEYALSLYLDFLETEKRIQPEKFNSVCFSSAVIEEWLVWIATKRGCSPASCNVRLASLRVFLKYLGSRSIAYRHLYQEATLIEARKSVRKKVVGMSKKAVQTLLSVPDVSTKTGRRDMALMIMLYSTAARIDEILSLKVKHLNLEIKKPYATVIGKNDKIRTLYLLPQSVAHMRKYIEEHHGKNPNPEAYVFYSRNTGIFGMMTQPAVKKRLSLHAKEAHKICADVPIDLHAHQLRHAKASHWLEDGMNIVQISFLLGHEHLDTTMVYLDVTSEQETQALATLETENEKATPKKWKSDKSGLARFCGVRGIKKK